jgi:xanthine dehydrogenase YagS FAD-binding subunit
MLYELPPVEHLTAHSVDEAVGWLAKYGEKAKVVGGGTDLLGLMKDKITGPRMAMPEVLIDIKRIPGLSEIRYQEGRGLTIGAAATLTSIERSEIVLEKYPILARSSGQVATGQIRNMGTLGGNLCQRPWCWYFRVPQFDCYKKGGSMCPAITGNNKYYFSILGLGICVMAHPSDTAPALVALGASAKIVGKSGPRTVPMEKFFTSPREVSETVVKPDELLAEIHVPEPRQSTFSVYLKERPRQTWDFALASVATLTQINDGVCEEVRIILGGVAPYPYRAHKAEDLLRGREIGREAAAKAGEAAVSEARPLKMNRYKIPLTRALVRQAVVQCFDRASSKYGIARSDAGSADSA